MTTKSSSQQLLQRVQTYAATGTVDTSGLKTDEVQQLYHVLHRLHERFIRQYDCDEVKCDKTRKCPKCGVFRVQMMPQLHEDVEMETIK
ncbi:hypothetical protein THRCLA_03257 [Thraustotheca clavata]|uniref:Uncharacterized protein n=1 Tax=Thraustotheca clavata TaxID=74557 RepID=A0A1W0A2M7_9STRA|nr:hypothetical protein THRCLA_03257 [Thraustotheca clavata]